MDSSVIYYSQLPPAWCLSIDNKCQQSSFEHWMQAVLGIVNHLKKKSVMQEKEGRTIDLSDGIMVTPVHNGDLLMEGAGLSLMGHGLGKHWRLLWLLGVCVCVSAWNCQMKDGWAAIALSQREKCITKHGWIDVCVLLYILHLFSWFILSISYVYFVLLAFTNFKFLNAVWFWK